MAGIDITVEEGLLSGLLSGDGSSMAQLMQSMLNQVIAAQADEAAGEGTRLPRQYKDHPLSGNWKGFRDCHIEPDWLLIYKIENDTVIFSQTGTHSYLFG